MERREKWEDQVLSAGRESARENWEGPDLSAGRESAREKWEGLDLSGWEKWEGLLSYVEKESGVSSSVAYLFKGILCMTREYLYFQPNKP